MELIPRQKQTLVLAKSWNSIFHWARLLSAPDPPPLLTGKKKRQRTRINGQFQRETDGAASTGSAFALILTHTHVNQGPNPQPNSTNRLCHEGRGKEYLCVYLCAHTYMWSWRWKKKKQNWAESGVSDDRPGRQRRQPEGNFFCPKEKVQIDGSPAEAPALTRHSSSVTYGGHSTHPGVASVTVGERSRPWGRPRRYSSRRRKAEVMPYMQMLEWVFMFFFFISVPLQEQIKTII